ncbi:MAG: phage/plasmid primase, P4 family, partial [Pseudomonadota bacterium]
SVERLPHDRSYLCSKMAEADYNEDATAPTFTAFLERIQPEPDRREFLQRWFGYTLLGLTTEQKLLFAHGDGRKGKSTLIDVIAQILADYATTVPIESLTGSEQRKGSDATPDLVRIPGARMVRASEPEQGQKMKEALVKALTGGEPVMVRRMHQEFIEVTPEFKLTISGNHRPEIRGGDDGIWRRVLLCPFDQQIPLDEVDPDLPAKLQAEIDGIFAWMVAGAVKWLTDGLKTPGDVMAASNEYRLESDPLREFLLGECVITGSESDWITSADVIDVFRLMQEETGDDPWTKRTVAKTLKDRSAKLKHPDTGATFWPHKRNGTVDYKGLAFGLDAASALARVIDRRSRL